MMPPLVGQYICEKCQKNVKATDRDIYSVVPRCKCGGRMFFQPFKHTGPVDIDEMLGKKY